MKIDFSLILFVLFAFFVCSTAPSYFYREGKYMASFTSFIVFILIFVFFGMRWFSGAELVGPGAGYTGAWPPQISVCPDYLTYGEYTKNTQKVKGCYNATGFTIGDMPSTSIVPTAAGPSTFDYSYSPSATKQDKATLCAQAKAKKISWEGITDSESCTF
jgi:hypothetical protein